MRNPQLLRAELRFAPLELDPTFPLEVVLDGERDDTPVTQLHAHDGFELGCCLAGSGTFYVGAKILPFRAGDITVLTDREFHRCRSSPGTRSRWAWFFFHPVRLLVPHVVPALAWDAARLSGPSFVNVLRPSRHPRLAALLQQAIAEARGRDAYTQANLRALLLLLVHELQRTVARPRRPAPPDTSAPALERLAPALEHIAAAFDEPLTVPALARRCRMSVRSFQAHFKRLLGHSPQTHVMRSRIHAAAALLAHHERPITEIAHQCGFATLSSFHRAFRAAYGTNPRTYRQRERAVRNATTG